MSTRRLVSVVVPSMNEEESIPLFYAAVSKVTAELSEYDWEFVFVDDGSTDRTSQVLHDLSVTDPRVCMVQLSRNFGSYAAIQAGFQHASGDAIICISADLQDPPELFTDFTRHWSEGYHVVWGVRTKRDDSIPKKAPSYLFYWTVRGLGIRGLPLGGMDCGLFDRRVIDTYLRFAEQNNNVFLTIFQLGYRQKQVPYRRRERVVGTTKWNVAKLVKAALDVITSVSYLPIRICSLLGVVFALLSLGGMLFVAIDKFFINQNLPVGWPSVMVAVLLVGGVQLLMLGVLGEYLWRISSEVRRKPPFVVMDTLGIAPGKVSEAGMAKSGRDQERRTVPS